MKDEWEYVEKNIYRSKTDSHKFNVWLYYGRDANGKTKKSTKTLKNTTLTEARKYLKDFETKRDKGEAVTPGKVRLKQLIDDWNSSVGDVRNEETTKNSNRNIQKHLLSYFGDTYVTAIDASSIDAYMAHAITNIKYRGKPLSKKTANKHRTHLHTLYEYARKRPGKYGIVSNPVDLVEPFKVEDADISIFDANEAKEVIGVLHGLNRPDFEIAVNLGLWCGSRREEVCGLRWRSVNFDANTIKIIDIRTTANGTVIDRAYTKSKKIRNVGMPSYLKGLLKNEKRRQEALGIKLDYVFCHNDGTPWHPNSLSREYTNFLNRYGFKKIRFHDLRHTASSLLLTKLDPVVVAEILGHQQVSTTLGIYAHVVGKSTDIGRETMDALLGDGKKEDNEA